MDEQKVVCDLKHYTVFIDVVKYYSWIEKHLTHNHNAPELGNIKSNIALVSHGHVRL